MKVAYFNCSSGIAGDMIIASCLDAGLPFQVLRAMLERNIRVGGLKLKARRVERSHYPGKLFVVGSDHQYASPAEMRRTIARSAVPGTVRKAALEIMENLISAESKVHRLPPAKIHFHELSSVDTVVDILGGVFALHALGVERVHASPVNVGVPAPATLELLKKNRMPVYSTADRQELATPTGIAILGTIAEEFGPMPALALERSGFGAGMRDIPGMRNMLGLVIGNAGDKTGRYPTDEVVLLETNIDDMDPRVYPYVMEKLFEAGARDVWLETVMMKKGRPGTLLAALAVPSDEQKLADIIFSETTTLGIRRIPCSRHVLDRAKKGDLKIARLPGGKTRGTIEYEPARLKARATRRPLLSILKDR